MPLYEYQCESCGVRFEVIQKYADAPVATCKNCGGKVERLLSAPAIQFKGSGWYITDYARKGKSDGDASPASSSSSSSSTPTTSASDKTSPGGGTSTPATATPAAASPTSTASDKK